MSQTNYPNEAALQAFLVNAKIVATAPEGVAMYVDGAVEEWESKTGYTPFLGDSEDSTEYFDGTAPLRYLDLRGAYTSITSVHYGVTSDSDGTLGTLNSDYFLHYFKGAIVGIEFTGMISGNRTIKIVGKKGFCTELPSSVYRAILEKAAADAMPMLTQVNDAKKIKQGPVEIEQGSSRDAAWQEKFECLAREYQRI